MTHDDGSLELRKGMHSDTLSIMLGCASILGYILLFTAGAVIDSAPYRARLAPSDAQAVATGSSAGSLTTPVASPAGVSFLAAFVLVMFLYTPINVALLTLIAAFIGGCASNITFNRTPPDNLGTSLSEISSVSVLFRTENPFASMFRGFVVYLAFMAGIYITTANPFGNPTPEQYVRLAATLSLFSFIVGYDPTKFADFLKMLPSAGNAARK